MQDYNKHDRFSERSDVSFVRFKARGKFHRVERRGRSASERNGGARVCGIGQRARSGNQLNRKLRIKANTEKVPAGVSPGRDRAGSSWNSIYYRGVMHVRFSRPCPIVGLCLRVIGKLKPGCTIITRVSPRDRVILGLSWTPRADAVAGNGRRGGESWFLHAGLTSAAGG